MSFKYFRFYLSESELYDEKKTIEILESYQSIFDAQTDPSFIRASFDLMSKDKSISILCKSEDDIEIQKKNWQIFLTNKNITLKENIEYEVLQDEERYKIRCAHSENCSHDHHDHDHHDHHHHNDHDEHHDHHNPHKRKAIIGLVCGIGLLILSIASFNLPMIAYYLITGLSALVTLYLGYKVYESAFQSIKKGKIEMSTLYMISTLAIIGISIASLFVPWLPMMLESAPLILGFWHLGEVIEHEIIEKINENLDIRDRASKTALLLLKDGAQLEIPVKELIPNDMIIIKAGEVIPIDGVLTQPALLYTTRVNGSPYPKEFKPGDSVQAGMCLVDNLSQLEMRVTKTHQNSYLTSIAKNINKAENEKAPVEKIANNILKYFVPCLLAVALVSGVVVGLLFPPALAIQCVISVLVSACPCVLSIIIPTAVKIGRNKASEHGVNFKNGEKFQVASNINTVVFDINGTLTKGEPSVNSLAIDDKNRGLLKYFAFLEGKSGHPFAGKIKKYIEKQINDVVDESLEEISIEKGSHHSGVKGTISGETFMIGNIDMLRANGIDTINAPHDNVKNVTIYMVRGKEVVGEITLKDELREDAKATVKQLQSMGMEVHICTGADEETAKQYAGDLDISNSNICANAAGTKNADTLPNTPKSKASYILELQNKGRIVAMVGDGTNDKEAMVRANLGISVKSNIGDTLTKEHAGMFLQRDFLFPIATAFDVASKTKQNIFQNLFVSLTYNSVITLVAAGLLVAFGFALNPAIGVALMVVESAIVLANLYRLYHQKTVTLPSIQKNEFDETYKKIINEVGSSQKLSSDKHNVKVTHSDPDKKIKTSSIVAFGYFQPSNDRSVKDLPIPIDNGDTGLYLHT